MYKKDEFKKLDVKYNTHLYTGLIGFAMKYCHRQLEKFNINEKYSKVLEVGAGSVPHLGYLKHDYDEYFIVETSDYALESYKGLKKVKACSYDGKKLPFDDNFFDRIIISHCLEHIVEPEKFLFEMMSKLKKGGVLSISLQPTSSKLPLMYIFGGSAVKCCVPISSRLPVIISVLLLTLGFICSNFSMSSSRASLSFGFFASCIQGFKNCLIIFVSSALIQLGKKLDSADADIGWGICKILLCRCSCCACIDAAQLT